MRKKGGSRTASNKAIDELIKFCSRDPWKERLNEVLLDSHLLPVCEKVDMHPDELGEILGEWGSTTLWGCAFEDFLTRRYPPDSISVVDDFLKKRSWRVAGPGKQYLRALRDSVMSLYEIVDLSPGRHLVLQDLIRGGPPVTVIEKAASESLAKWDVIATRVVTVGKKTVISGGILPYGRKRADRVEMILNEVVDQTMENVRKHEAARGVNLTREKVLEIILPDSVYVFTSTWLLENIEHSTRPQTPLFNMEGEELLISEVHFPVKAGKDADLIQRISGIPGMESEPSDDPFWNWLEMEGGRKKTASQSGGVALSTTHESGLTVLGTLELKKGRLLLSVNSKGRADRGAALLTKHAGDLLGPPLTSHQTPEQFMESREGSGEPDEPDDASDIPPEEKAKILQQLFDRHYRRTMRERIPALGDKTPKQAMRTKAGREKVIRWLKDLENHEMRRAKAQGDEPYDTSWMWEELGLDRLGDSTDAKRSHSKGNKRQTSKSGKDPRQQGSRSGGASASKVPIKMRPVYEKVIDITDAFCAAHLTADYADLARAMTAALCRKRPSPVLKGRPKSWAAGVVYALGQINFLWDPTFEPHMTAKELCSKIGVSQGTASGKAREISQALNTGQMDPKWSIPEMIETNPMVWMLEVNGLVMDVRKAPPEIQDMAFEQGLIPYVPYKQNRS
ncbi:MAG: hypothetical protein HQL53_03540 [Magnetococcales bacterium]|nr:hypothetical protein [Magnetococcales bacterium]